MGDTEALKFNLGSVFKNLNIGKPNNENEHKTSDNQQNKEDTDKEIKSQKVEQFLV